MSAKKVIVRALSAGSHPEAKTLPSGEERLPGGDSEAPSARDNPFLRGSAPSAAAPVAHEPAAPGPQPVLGWGGSPTPIPSAHQGLRPVTTDRPPSGRSPAGLTAFPVAALLRSRPKERGGQVRRALHGTWVGRRHVMVASLFGGTGTSTLAVLLWGRLRRLQLPAVLIDATGGYVSGIAARVPAQALMQGPSWATMARLNAGHAGSEFAERFPGLTDDPPAMLIGGAGREQRPPTKLTMHAVRAALASWPLVLTDAPADFDAIGDLAGSGQPDMLLMTCRPDSGEVRATADFLRSLDRAGSYAPQQSAVIAIVHGPRVHRDVLAARASAADIAAGVILIRRSDRLLPRTAPISSSLVSESIDLLAAAAAICQQEGTP